MKKNMLQRAELPTGLVNTALQVMLDNTSDMMFVKDAGLIYVAASLPFVKMAGKKSVEEIVGRSDYEIFADKNLAVRYIKDDEKLLKYGTNLLNYIEPITEENGHARYGSTSKYILTDDDGDMIGVLGVTRDITREYIARQRYQKELRYLFELPADTYAVSYVDVDDWRIISQRRQLIREETLQAAHTVEELCEAALESMVNGRSEVAEFYRSFAPDFLKEIYDSGKNSLSFKYQRRLPNGAVRWVHNEVRFLTDVDSGNLCVMLSAKDIDAEKREEQRLILSARMDKMTMVLNRETTMEYIRQVLEEESDSQHALFMLDVDNFKALNDTLGHQAGDKFLVAFSAQLKKSFRDTDIVGRIGGDEFFALMKNVPGAAEVEKKAQRLLEAVRLVCEEYSQVHLSISIGISMYPDMGVSLEELYTHADDALYKAKSKGKNQFFFVRK